MRCPATSVLPSSPGEKVQSSPAIPHENWVIQVGCDNFGVCVEKPKVQEGSFVGEVVPFRFRPRLCLQGRELLRFRVEVQKANSRKRSLEKTELLIRCAACGGRWGAEHTHFAVQLSRSSGSACWRKVGCRTHTSPSRAVSCVRCFPSRRLVAFSKLDYPE